MGDLHNVLGIVTLVWALVVGAIGVINTWVNILLNVWQYDQMTQMIMPYQRAAETRSFGIGGTVRARNANQGATYAPSVLLILIRTFERLKIATRIIKESQISALNP